MYVSIDCMFKLFIQYIFRYFTAAFVIVSLMETMVFADVCLT